MAPFQIDSAAARTGNASLLTSLRSEPTHEGTAIVGALQEVSAARAGHRIPTSVGGHYRVDAWETDVEHTYVQVVLSFFPSPDASAWCRGLDPRYPCQLAIILAGTDEVPLGVANRVFVLPESDWVGKHEWTYFEYDVGALMQQAWAVASLDYDRLWIYLEVRYDGAQGPRNVAADVRWDDVWLGSALQAHAPRDN